MTGENTAYFKRERNTNFLNIAGKYVSLFSKRKKYPVWVKSQNRLLCKNIEHFTINVRQLIIKIILVDETVRGHI